MFCRNHVTSDQNSPPTVDYLYCSSPGDKYPENSLCIHNLLSLARGKGLFRHDEKNQCRIWLKSLMKDDQLQPKLS